MALAVALSAGCEPAAVEPAPAPRTQEPPKLVVKEEPKEETLEQAIESALKLLVERDFEGFRSRFAPPGNKVETIEGAPPVEFARTSRIEEKRFVLMILLMSHIRNKAPKMSKDGSTATYDVRGVGGNHPDEVTFKKIDGRWYLE